MENSLQMMPFFTEPFLLPRESAPLTTRVAAGWHPSDPPWDVSALRVLVVLTLWERVKGGADGLVGGHGAADPYHPSVKMCFSDH